MTVYFSYTVSTKGATYAIAVHGVDGMELLKNGYCMLMLDRCYQLRSVKLLEEEYGEEYVAEAARMRYMITVDRKFISPAQVEKRSRDSKYMDGDCAKQSGVYRKNVASAELRASARRRI